MPIVSIQVSDLARHSFRSFHRANIVVYANIVMDSDRVLVLDEGRIAEYDTPEALLEKKDGIFKGMVEKGREARGK